MTTPFGGEALGEILNEMHELRSRLAEAQASVNEQEVQGSAGRGAVRISASGEFSFRSVAIDPSLLADGDVTVLEDLVLAALHDLTTKLIVARQGAMQSVIGTALENLFPDELAVALQGEQADEALVDPDA